MIWVVSGTVEARRCVEALVAAGHRVTATTTTTFGKNLISPGPGLEVIAGALDLPAMSAFIRDGGVRLVVDASHPFAENASRNAMAAASAAGVPYIRYERGETDPGADAGRIAGFEEAARYLEDKSGNVLLTIGSRHLDPFREGPGRKVYARVLPLPDSLAACERAGIGPDRIIAMRFPFSTDLHRALFEALEIRFLVTKETGAEGGLPEKLEAAGRCGVRALIVERPRPDYPAVAGSVEEILAFAEARLHG